MTVEQERLKDRIWKKWGPYVSDRQWGTVREDYSANGDAWNYSTHDMARSKAYRWGEEGIAGISDERQLFCFSLALWNGQDPIVKEVLFGLSNKEGNHGEDVKELYYYLDNTPSHSYMKMLYKYPQSRFPYAELREENIRRTKAESEYELIDTGIFDQDAYFDVFVEYAKAGPEDILIRFTVHNRGHEAAPLDLLPTLWFRNTWSWDKAKAFRPSLGATDGAVLIQHPELAVKALYYERGGEALFCSNETNPNRLFGNDTIESFYKDGINEFVVNGMPTVNPDRTGTKAAVRHSVIIPGGESREFRLRLSDAPAPIPSTAPAAAPPKPASTRKSVKSSASSPAATPPPIAPGAFDPFADFDRLFADRLSEADAFYQDLQQKVHREDERMVQRQAFAGILWNKQFYHYNIQQWLTGDPAKPAPPAARLEGRNHDWKHLHNADIISMPDKWEYPWYANWDLAFQCVTLALVDDTFAKQQLELLTKDWYMHPNGKMPAYEWSFNDANPPVYAWATWEVYYMGKKRNGGQGDLAFLESVFHKLMINFTWWVNLKDTRGHNIFEGGFLGLDNIGVFDRNTVLPDGILEQADATSWMAQFALTMLRISVELSYGNQRYLDMASKFFSHFLYIAGAIEIMGDGITSLWDPEDRFFYDQIRKKDTETVRLKVRSMVSLIPLFAVDILDRKVLDREPVFEAHVQWFLENRPDLMALVSQWWNGNRDDKHLLSLVNDKRLKNVLTRMLDESEFLSEYGIRSLSKFHEENPYVFSTGEATLSVAYVPGESDSDMYGGNSNWRGPLWIPVNFMLIRSLKRFHQFYGERFKVRCPSVTGDYKSLDEVAGDLSNRLIRLFVKDEQGRRKIFGDQEKLQTDPHFKDYLLFYEYFHGETGAGLGASHQTGWTALIANLIQMKAEE